MVRSGGCCGGGGGEGLVVVVVLMVVMWGVMIAVRGMVVVRVMGGEGSDG